MNLRTRFAAGGFAAAALVTGALLAGSNALAAPGVAELKLDPQGASKALAGGFQSPLALKGERPAAITKEPAYAGTPKYTSVKLGNDAKAVTWVALDEPEGGEWKIYVDVNGNGDLTDDGNGAWITKSLANGRTFYSGNRYLLDASWDLGGGKSVQSKYGIAFRRVSGTAPLIASREAVRTGVVAIDGKDLSVALMENDADGVFHKPVEKPEDARNSRPVWLLIDLNGDGKFDPRANELFDIRGPFKIGEKTYEAIAAVDGSTLKVAETTRAVIDLSGRKPLLAVGSVVPDFSAEAWGGAPLKLSDYRGKVVVLDFWATWCGPCQRSMPHLEELYKKVKGPNVQVLALCVWDTKAKYEDWVPKNKEKYTFQFAFDPAANDNAKSIASSLFNVTGIPTTYVIDKDGKVAAAVVGFQGDGDHRVQEALEKLGIKAN